jgi:hypothetical protein
MLFLSYSTQSAVAILGSSQLNNRQAKNRPNTGSRTEATGNLGTLQSLYTGQVHVAESCSLLTYQIFCKDI